MAYVPNAATTTEPIESRTVESAALEFRTLKAATATIVADMQAIGDQAAASALEALNSATAAENSAITANSELNDFKGRYYGAMSANPALDPLGAACSDGDLYFNTSTNRMMAYAGGTWYATETLGATDAALVTMGSMTVKSYFDSLGTTRKSKPLRRTLSQILKMGTNFNTPERLRVFCSGDSLGNSASYLVYQLISAFGFAGFMSPCAISTIAAGALNGGGATVNSGFVYTDSPTGDTVSIGAAGNYAGVTIVVNQNSNVYLVADSSVPLNSKQLNISHPVCNLVKAIYIGGAGGATFKVQYTSDNVNWTDVASLTAVDASLTTGHQTVTGAITECRVMAVRCLWVSGGTTKIYAMGAESTTRSGVVVCSFNRGSIALGPIGFAGGAGAANLLSTCAPHLFTSCALDGTVALPNAVNGIVEAMTSLNALLAALPVVPDQLWYGLPNTSGDPEANTVIYNEASKLYAESIGAAFIDTHKILGSWATANALTYMQDATHPNLYGWGVVNQELQSLYGFSEFIRGEKAQPKQDSPKSVWRGNLGAWPNGTAFTLVTTGTTEITPELQMFRAGSWVPGSIQIDRLLLDQIEEPSCDRYGVRIQATSGSGILPSLSIVTNPARLAAGRQVTLRLKIKAAAAGTLSVFYGRYAGSGSQTSAGNNVLTYGTTWREYTYTVTIPQLLDAEAATSVATFSLQNFASGSDISFKEIGVFLGPIADRVHTSDFVETYNYNFGSIPANSMISTTIPVIGVKIGEAVQVRRPVGMTQAIILDAAVTTDNVITLYATNPTIAAIVLPALNYVLTVG